MTASRNAIANYTIDQISEGMSVYYETQLTKDDVSQFASLTGDTNPLHVDPAFGKNSVFGINISHGLLGVSLFSTIVGVLLPGQNALLNEVNCRFTRPVPIDSKVVVSGRVSAVSRSRGTISLSLLILLKGEVCVEGNAVVTVLASAKSLSH